MRKNFRFGTMAMAAMIAASMAMSSPVVSHAEELDANSDVGDVLDNIFGQDKPQGNPDDYKDAPSYEGGIEVDEVDWSTGGLVDSGSSDNSGNSGDSGNSGNSDNSGNSGNSGNAGGSGNTNSSGNSGGSMDANSGVGDVLDSIFGQDKPQGNPDDYKDAPTYEGGIEVGEVDWSTGGLVDASTSGGTATTLPAIPSLAVKVTDPALAAQFPAGALYAATPENTVFFHSISNDGLAYNVWFNGVVGDQFSIADAAGKTVAISNPDVLYVNGKCYVSVTVSVETQGAHVVATEAQKAAFTRLFSVDGVMVNGVLVEEFQDTVQN